MNSNVSITSNEALQIGNQLGVNWSAVNLEQFQRGLEVELEHGLVNEYTDVTHNDYLLTGKIALAHLNELPDYYSRLASVESPDFKQSNISNNNLLYGIALGAGIVLFGQYLLKKTDKRQKPTEDFSPT